MSLLKPSASEPTLDEELWNREYTTLRVIPSSTRRLPSKALLLYSELLDFTKYRRVLDAGCGTGRNSIYLAQKGCEVHAVDFSQAALDVLKREAFKAGVAARLTAYHQALGDTFLFDDQAFDFIIDSYVFTHFVTPRFREAYRKELYRVVKKGGLVFSSVFSVEDEYYKAMLKAQQGEEGTVVVMDPHNGITKTLYTGAAIRSFYEAVFRVLYLVKFEFDDAVMNTIYRRSILALMLMRET